MVVIPNIITIDTADPPAASSAKLIPFFQNNRRKFEQVITAVHLNGKNTAPAFPPVVVSSIAPVPEGKVDAFREAHIDNTKYKESWRFTFARQIQYTRWDWAMSHTDDWVNVLRVVGFTDDRIQRMFDGTPMCFATDAEYKEFRTALRDLKPLLENELGWKDVAFVITGSSVPGFSQNPLKGLVTQPTRVTDPESSDVDVCIVGDGVNETMRKKLMNGETEPQLAFDTTCTRTTSATRYGFRDQMKSLSPIVHDFWQTWEDKLSGGLQLTFAENDCPTPPWESRIDIDNL